ncbi:hypothetical protein JWZ98_02030 [Methylomonas sp. EFPC1]|uniref:hypothetical protein n=1 Tax=Methylomonas sp. EFPC1 TaxID=2812647 RepID=UPI00196771CA|nr:hypothetical protein [Methylomonas sp. EFPC1]QSB01766.1 hypothetical protein JWZ98_02030 [Methylomonas sp. EFPC1]
MKTKERFASLLDGRNVAPLTEREKSRASNVFLGMDPLVSARYEAGSRTRFIEAVDDDGEEYGEIVFSDDIYPGTNLVNPNASLSLPGAAAHELSHYHRWRNKSELPHGELTHIDEAMTSLEAALRFSANLGQGDIQGLISDSLHRLRLYLAELENQNET